MIDLDIWQDGTIEASYGGDPKYRPAQEALATVLTRLTQMQLNARRLADSATPVEKSASDSANGLAAANARIVSLEATIEELHKTHEKTSEAYRKAFEDLKKKHENLVESIGELAREAGHNLNDEDA